MKLNEIPINSIFTIEETPSYPKLRTEKGYIDMRDVIIVNRDIDFDLRIMTIKEVADKFETTEQDIEEWIVDVKKLVD